MTDLPLHPALVHLPLGVALLVPVLAGAVAWAWRADKLPRQAWLLVLGTQLVLVGGSQLALWSGEEEEERVEHRVAEELLESHEERAEIFAALAGGVLLLAIGAAAWPQEQTARAIAYLATALSVLVALSGLAVGHAGGEIAFGSGAHRGSPATVHPEWGGERHEDDEGRH